MMILLDYITIKWVSLIIILVDLLMIKPWNGIRSFSKLIGGLNYYYSK